MISRCFNEHKQQTLIAIRRLSFLLMQIRRALQKETETAPARVLQEVWCHVLCVLLSATDVRAQGVSALFLRAWIVVLLFGVFEMCVYVVWPGSRQALAEVKSSCSCVRCVVQMGAEAPTCLLRVRFSTGS